MTSRPTAVPFCAPRWVIPAAAAVLFAASVILAAAGVWLLAVALLTPLGWLAGRFTRGQRIADLTAGQDRYRTERDHARGRVWALTEERRHGWNHYLDARSGDQLRPDVRPDWAGVNGQTSTTRPATGAHTTTPA